MVEYQFVALKVVGSNPIIYPILNFILKHRPGYYFLKKHKIRRRMFKKKKFLFIFFNFLRFLFNSRLKIFKKWDILKNYNIFKYKNTNNVTINSITTNNDNYILQILYKNKAAKGTISFKETITTISVGDVLKSLKLSIKKSVRRSVSGLNVFLNFLKKVFLKKIPLKGVKNILLNINGFDNRLFVLRKKICTNFLKKNAFSTMLIYLFLNLKVSFTKKKGKKIKSIKKRLRKKILINFLTSIAKNNLKE